ncbi:5'-3' exonuclease PLD3 isoform X2 [Cololabis saira]|uniref:5'-3' exonuclease PLD3 isoform X2 n=1 Tax=Cololabis saira TaxID=129043 RepID=UPI002AD43EA2|nr:5'-3' exonuclease PLD3 isoform X2 [Cololabis saira]
MPMVLRSRRPGQADGLGLQEPRRGSARLQPDGYYYEESDESESESVPGGVMERRELEEEDAAEHNERTFCLQQELKECSVVLDRLHGDDRFLRREAEEKEDMSRKGGKLVSRIPTFQKRSPGTGQNTETPVPKKDTPPPETAASASVETLKSHPPEIRETAVPQPSIRGPKMSHEALSMFSGDPSPAAGRTSVFTALGSFGAPESLQYPLMAASPRPAIRPEQDTSTTSETEAVAVPDVSTGYLRDEGSLIQTPQENTWNTVTDSGDVSTPAGSVHKSDTSQVEAIMDEEPPWEAEPIQMDDLKDSRSSSDAESEDGFPGDKSESHDSEHHDSAVTQSDLPDLAEETETVDESTCPPAPEDVTKASSAKSTEKSGSSSFACLCFLPMTLLLLGGFGQHIWRYGLPNSVSQLTGQLELHWLEGFGLVPEPCSTECRVRLVESIPAGLYPSSPSSRLSIADSWLHLLDKANSSVHIAAFYFSLRDSDLEFTDPSDSQGRQVFERLMELEARGLKLQVAVNAPQTSTQDTADLAATGAEIREVDLKAMTGGIVHTKLWVVDQKHLYLGSANMDWRSLSQVREVGLLVEDCSCLAQDASRIFGVYWGIGGVNGSIPPYWPARLSALSSAEEPLQLKLNGVPAQVYLSSAPPQISARGRSDDLSTILSVINDAQEFIYISVMDYLPLSPYTNPPRFWAAIDTNLRDAACARGVQVRLMVSCWEHSPASMFTFLQSLLVLSRPPLKCAMDVRVFTVPSTAEQMKIPFARVNHAKYMVTDRVVYIGTSNWSENYFTQTAGVGLVVNQTGSAVTGDQRTLQSEVRELFLQDWSSQYARAPSIDDVNVCPRAR